MKLIITGALGHIGSYLISQLEKQSIKFDKIILIDNLTSQRYSSLFNLSSSLHFEFYQEDVRFSKFGNILNNNDIVIHLAAITNAAESFYNSDQVENNNFNSTKNVADLCYKKKSKLIHISSTSVYGTQKNIVDENCDKTELKPQSPYASTKLKEEDYFRKLFSKGLKGVILRFGTIFGNSIGMRFHTAVNKFCLQSSLNLELTVWRHSYHQKRPYLDIEDAKNAIFHIIKRDLFNSEIYNVLTCNSTVAEIVKIIKKTRKLTKVKFVDNQIMNQLSYEVCKNKFEKTNFIFKGNIENQIYKTLNQFSSINNEYER